MNLNTRVCMPSPWAHSQRLHVGVLRHIPHLHRAVMGRAVELVGASAERQPLGVHGKREEGDLGYSRRDRGQVQGQRPKKHVLWHREPALLESTLWGSMWSQRYSHLPLSSKYRLLGGLLLPRQARLNLPQLFPIASPCFCPIHQSAGSMRVRTVCVSHAIPWSPAPSLAHSGA